MILDEYTGSAPLAITLGDPAGIGPEVVARVVAERLRLQPSGRPWLLIGSGRALARGAAVAGLAPLDLPCVSAPAEARAGVALLDLDPPLPTGGADAEIIFGRVDAACGAVSVAAIEHAARACLAGTVAGMVTAPIHKEAIQAAGYVNDIGHQEILARLTGARATATVLMTPGLRVVHLSTHKSLADAVRHVTRENVLARLRLTADTFARWGLPDARIAVAALNPHGGEGGLLGREEIEALTPAVADARAEGIDASGPWPADSVFNRAIAGEFDVVLALYHDQGHIAIKVHDFHGSTTATLGLPFVRTSVDHGTAFDIAGRGVADARSMAAAIRAAEALLVGRVRDL